jgi:uncharacterized membrane protein YccC
MKQKVKTLIPVPKVLVPAVAGLVALGGKVIATGELHREELAAVWVLAGYAAIGWWTPEGR